MEIANPLVVRYFYYSHGVENYATDTSVSEAERNYAVMSVVFLQKLQAGRGPHATSSTTEERNTNNNFFRASPTQFPNCTGHVDRLTSRYEVEKSWYISQSTIKSQRGSFRFGDNEVGRWKFFFGNVSPLERKNISPRCQNHFFGALEILTKVTYIYICHK